MTREDQKIDILISGVRDNCYAVAKDLIIEHDKDIRSEVIDEVSKYIINSCKNVNCREDITIDNDYDFYASELLDMLEQLKEQK